jgi:GTP-binding protein
VKIGQVEFAGTMVDPEAPYPGDLPQVAFAGRSNVGKSSLINVLLGRTKKKIAHVSATPGKTQGLNFYQVDEKFFLVDLPGYGFAQAPASVRESWKGLVDGYLSRKDGPRAVVLLIDVRRDPTPDDRRLLERLAALALPTLIVLTKMDKLTHSQKAKRVEKLVGLLEVDSEQVVPFSSMSGEGKELLLDALDGVLSFSEK